MIRFLMLSVSIWLNVTYALSQDNTSFVKNWQEQNPHVHFVSHERFNLLSPEERDKLENKEVIFFNDQITVGDIYKYESNQEKAETYTHYTPQEVKDWSSNHPEVKLIKNSSYVSSPEIIKEEYRACTYCLILEGEYLTLSDIRNYETEKQ